MKSSSDNAAALPPGAGSSGNVNAATASGVIGRDLCGNFENKKRGEAAAGEEGSAVDIANRRRAEGTSRISEAVWVPLGTLMIVERGQRRNRRASDDGQGVEDGLMCFVADKHCKLIQLHSNAFRLHAPCKCRHKTIEC